ncbi:MAG: DNA polymerase III subunit chi, partial [Desulfuromonadales bacterium]
MPKVSFIRLKKPEKAKHLCELAEESFLAGKRVYITVLDDNQGVTLDRFMWTWKKGSFIPHALSNGAVECLDEPVAIGT